MQISGSVALVTGANRGIGVSIVDALLAAGAARVYAAVRDPASVTPRPGVVPLALDVTDPAQIEAAARAAGDVSILVNNAGIAVPQPLFAPADEGAAEREMAVNYFGTLRMARAFAPILAKNGGGAIVNILSILGRVSAPRLGTYSASKAAAFSLTQALRAELRRQGTLVVGVLPGYVDTDMAKTATGPKLAPSAVADSVLEALRQGTEDVYPGIAADVALALQQDPKAVERQFAGLE